MLMLEPASILTLESFRRLPPIVHKGNPGPEQITADIQSAIERLERELDELKLAEKNKKTEIRKHMKALAILNGGQDNQATQTKE